MGKLVKALAVAVVFILAAETASAGGLAAHQAVYRMSLRSTSQGSGIAAAQGKLTYKFSDACTGWTVEMTDDMDVTFAEGGDVNSLRKLITWEAKDGGSYRFKVVQPNREGVDVTSGESTLGADGGTARYDAPEPMTLDLPKGALHPTAHTKKLIQAALNGDKIFTRIVFDGSDQDNPFDMNAVITHALPAGAETSLPGNALLKGPSWRMRIAFFSRTDNAATPTAEMSLRYHENGVAEEVVRDYGNYSIALDLIKLDTLPKPEC